MAKIRSKVMQETSQKIHKVHKSMEKISIYFLTHFKHVKISQNSQKCIKKHIAIFLGIFARKLARTGVQIARTEVCIAKTQEKIENKPKAHKYKAQNPRSGSGSSRCLRGVGLIRIP